MKIKKKRIDFTICQVQSEINNLSKNETQLPTKFKCFHCMNEDKFIILLLYIC